MACDNYLPPFQPQNPALSGDRYGWYDCTAFSGAMAAAFDSCGDVKLTGGQIRAESNEPRPDPRSPGLALSQVADVLSDHGVELDIRYAYPWAKFRRRINEGQGAILQLSYEPIHRTHFSGDPNFTGGHAIFVPPGWGAMDPLCDGRRAGIHRYDGSAYPKALLREAAGMLVLGVGSQGPRRLGDGLVYAAFTQDRRRSWQATVRPLKGKTQRGYWRYHLDDRGRITGRKRWYTRGFTADCTAPKRHPWPAKGRKKALVEITSGSRRGIYIGSPFAEVVGP